MTLFPMGVITSSITTPSDCLDHEHSASLTRFDQASYMQNGLIVDFIIITCVSFLTHHKDTCCNHLPLWSDTNQAKRGLEIGGGRLGRDTVSVSISEASAGLRDRISCRRQHEGMVEVGVIRCACAKTGMRPAAITKGQIATEPRARFGHAGIGMHYRPSRILQTATAVRKTRRATNHAHPC